MHFHCSRIEDATQPTSVCIQLSAGQTFSRLSEFSNLRLVWCCSAQCPTPLPPEANCNADLRIDFNRIGTCFDIVSRQYWCVLLSCPFQRHSRRRHHGCGHVLELERPILPRCCSGIEIRQFQEYSRLDESRSQGSSLTSDMVSASAAFWFQRSNKSAN